jgi:hypothetical protein
VTPARPPAVSIGLIAATIAAGLALRMVPLGLPCPLVKYGGSMLWAAMLYWIVSALPPFRSPARAGLASVFVAFAVELSQLTHGRALDAFRTTATGALLLGRVFSVRDLLAYTVAISMVAACDNLSRQYVVFSYMR